MKKIDYINHIDKAVVGKINMDVIPTSLIIGEDSLVCKTNDMLARDIIDSIISMLDDIKNSDVLNAGDITTYGDHTYAFAYNKDVAEVTYTIKNKDYAVITVNALSKYVCKVTEETFKY